MLYGTTKEKKQIDMITKILGELLNPYYQGYQMKYDPPAGVSIDIDNVESLEKANEILKELGITANVRNRNITFDVTNLTLSGLWFDTVFKRIKEQKKSDQENLKASIAAAKTPEDLKAVLKKYQSEGKDMLTSTGKVLIIQQQIDAIDDVLRGQKPKHKVTSNYGLDEKIRKLMPEKVQAVKEKTPEEIFKDQIKNSEDMDELIYYIKQYAEKYSFKDSSGNKYNQDDVAAMVNNLSILRRAPSLAKGKFMERITGNYDIRAKALALKDIPSSEEAFKTKIQKAENIDQMISFIEKYAESHPFKGSTGTEYNAEALDAMLYSLKLLRRDPTLANSKEFLARITGNYGIRDKAVAFANDLKESSRHKLR